MVSIMTMMSRLPGSATQVLGTVSVLGCSFARLTAGLGARHLGSVCSADARYGATTTASPAGTQGRALGAAGCEVQLRPVAAFLDEQLARGALQPDESQQAAAHLLDGVFISFLQHIRHGRIEGRFPAHMQQPAGHAQKAPRYDDALSSGGVVSASAASAVTATGSSRDGSVQGSGGAHEESAGVHLMLQQQACQGAYLWGEVGSGKTLLMDAFYRAAAALAVPEAPQQQPAPGQDMQPTPVAAPSQAPTATIQQRQVAPGASPATGAAAPEEVGTSNSSDNSQGTGSPSSGIPGGVARRAHFHAFMLDVHKRLHDLHRRVPRVAAKSRQGLPIYRYAPILEDPVRLVGHQIAQEALLLCLDELHVTDVADALILNKLFAAILDRGTWVLFTSNRPPQDLYKGGLSRKYFEPFIHLIAGSLQAIRVGSGIDYRQQQQDGLDRWLPQQQQQLVQRQTQAWSQHRQQQQPEQQQTEGAYLRSDTPSSLAGPPATWQGQRFVGPAGEAGPRLRAAWILWQQHHQAQVVQDHSLPVGFGRELRLPQAAWTPDQLATYLTFDQLCGRHGTTGQERHLGAALGPADFVSIASQVNVLFLEGVPPLGPAQHDEARRFLTLIDAVYDYGAKLCCSMAVSPRDIFLPLLAAAKAQGVDPNLGASRAAALEVPTVAAPSPDERDPEDRTTRATLEEEVIAYRRAMSRLEEMTRGSGGDA